MDPMPEDWDRAVIVVAHPDDLEYGCASAVARWTRQGRHVAYVVASAGEAGIEGMAPDVVGPLREQEERRSAGVVGVFDVDFLGHRDGLIEYGVPLRRDIAAAIRRHRPDVVITMSFDVTDTIDAGVASLREHKAYLDGLGGDFDPDDFLRKMAGFVGLAAGCEYAIGLRRYAV